MRIKHGFLALALVACVAGVALAETAKKDADATKNAAAAKGDAKAAAQQEAMMAEMMKLATPGAEHKKLESFVGTWKAVTKSWFAPGEPTVSEGVTENRLILGGRVLEQTFSGTMQGAPFEGYGLTGYDNKKKEYWSTWSDTWSTGIMLSTGQADGNGQIVTKATVDGPDGKPMKTRMVTKVVDDNSHVFSMYGTNQGKEQLMMEITYTKM
jgi:hypothetical protein